MLIAMLESGEQTVSALAGIAGLNLAMASHHLSVLLDAGIVKARRQSRFVYYSLAPGVASHRGKMLNLGCCVVGFDAMEAAGQGDVTTNGAQAG
jgi:DNA-binding transcriptional ArsR family regulator